MKKGKIKTLRNNILILFIAIVLLNIIFINLDACKYVETYEFVVLPGDTLWKIAEDNYSDIDDLNMHEVIYDIQELNNLDNCVVYEGQVLSLPVYI